MNKLRIILISNILKSKGGAFIATSRIAQILKKKYSVEFLIPNNKNIYNKIKIFLSNALKRIFIGKNRYLNSLNMFSTVNLKELKSDIIHLNWTGQELISIDEISKIKKPIIWTIHDMWVPNSTEHFLDNPNKKKYTLVDLNKNLLKKIIFKKKTILYKKKNIHFIANSKWLRDFTLKSDLTKKCKVNVIYNPIETNIWKRKNEKFSKKNLKLEINKNYILFGAHGGFSNFRKGGDLLIKSLKQLDVNKKNIEIIVLGGDFNASQIFDNYKFHFRKLEKDRIRQVMYHSAAILTVCPSRAESLPQFVVETILCGNPVVSFDVGGIKEIVEHKVNGFIAKPFNTKNFANGIKFCMSNIKRKNLEKQKNKIEKMFNEKKILQEYKKIIDKVNYYES